MSISLISSAWKLDLHPTKKFVLIALCDCANDAGECYPSVSNIVKKTSLGERTVQSAISELEVLGLLRREFRDGRSTVYWISIDGEPSSKSRNPRRSRTPAAPAPTPAAPAPTPAAPAPTPAAPAPQPPQLLHPEPSIEPSQEPSREPSKKRSSAKSAKPDFMSQDWKPSERCEGLLARAGIGADFYIGLIDEFVLYWEERAEKRAGWDATFLNHAKHKWQQKSLDDRTSQNQGFSKTNGGNSTAGKVINGKFSEKDYGESVIRLPGFPG